MKIVEYLIIVSTWLFSSYTFSSSDVEFRKVSKSGNEFQVEFGVIAHLNTKKIDLENILITLGCKEIVSVSKSGSDFEVVFKTAEKPNFVKYRAVFNALGYELNPKYLNLNDTEVIKSMNKTISDLKNK